jgi:hypothetical protein
MNGVSWAACQLGSAPIRFGRIVLPSASSLAGAGGLTPSVHPLQFEILRDRRAYGRAIVDARRIQHAGAAQEPRAGANLRLLLPAPRTSGAGAALPFGRGN